jgi:hypothetical protein
LIFNPNASKYDAIVSKNINKINKILFKQKIKLENEINPVLKLVVSFNKVNAEKLLNKTKKT